MPPLLFVEGSLRADELGVAAVDSRTARQRRGIPRSRTVTMLHPASRRPRAWPGPVAGHRWPRRCTWLRNGTPAPTPQPQNRTAALRLQSSTRRSLRAASRRAQEIHRARPERSAFLVGGPSTMGTRVRPGNTIERMRGLRSARKVFGRTAVEQAVSRYCTAGVSDPRRSQRGPRAWSAMCCCSTAAPFWPNCPRTRCRALSR
jgi:hypothetical protein